jgi:serine/threonine protein kinase
MFAAPETLLDDGYTFQRHGSKSDVYSLGLVFLEIHCVFEGYTVHNFRETIFQHIEETEKKAYHEVQDEIDRWADGDSLYDNCIKYMLLDERSRRPTAKEVLQILLSEASIDTGNQCECTRDMKHGDQSAVDIQNPKDASDDLDWTIIDVMETVEARSGAV